MRRTSTTGAILITMLAAGCGWSPPSGSPPAAAACTPNDSPQTAVVAAELATMPAPAGGGQWRESARGQTSNCRLNWVQATSNSAAPDSPGQVLFFDRAAPIGTATPQPRPYIAVVNSGADSVTVQYQWTQGDDQPCCPTGIGSVRFRIEAGQLTALDPIPGP